MCVEIRVWRYHDVNGVFGEIEYVFDHCIPVKIQEKTSGLPFIV